MSNRKSSAFMFTVNVDAPEEELGLDNIRKLVKITNRGQKWSKRRVVVRGRSPRVKGKDGDRTFSYDKNGNMVGGLRNATRMDVYVYRR